MTTNVATAKKTAIATTGAEQILQAVFSVCASEDVAAAVLDATTGLPGAEFVGQFAEYITAERRPLFPESIRNAGSCVALIDCDRDAKLACETMERLQQTFGHHLKLVAVAAQADPEFLLRVMRAGCSDVLQRPLHPADLTAVLKRFQQNVQHTLAPPQGSGKVLSFYGVKGGVGTTTMAVHLAIQLVSRGRRVLIIDDKHELGHVALHLGLRESSYYFDELLRNAERLDPELLEGFVTQHPSGIEVIPSPDSCARLAPGSPEAIGRVMRYLRTRYDFVLVDSSLEYAETFAAVTSASDEVTLVCCPDIASIRDLARRVEHLNSFAGFAEKLKIVINRATSADAVGAKEIQTQIKLPITASVPNNYASLVRALNEGEPIGPQHKSPFSAVFARWADRLCAEDDSAKMTAVKSRKRFFFGF